MLRYLVENGGQLVTKQDLVDAVWSRVAVTDNSLTRCIHQVRHALDDDAEQPLFIETVPGSGYRFIAAVGSDADGPAPGWRRSALLLVAAIALSAGLVATWNEYQPAAPQVQRLAVLPLDNLTGTPEQDYFVDGVHDALVAEMSRIASIDVISRTSVMPFRNSDLDMQEIAKRLDVDAVIEGSVLRAGDKLTVTVQLIATDPERHLWAERYHSNVSELFEITTDIVAAIAAEIAIEISPHPEPARRPPTVNPDAYEAYLRGRFHLEQRSPEGYGLAREQFQLATELDPYFAAPYAGLAHTFGSAAIFGLVRPADGFPEARRLAEKALELDDTVFEGHKILAGVAFYYDWNWDGAERRIEQALALNPNAGDAARLMAEIYSATGRHEEALAAIERGRAIDPLPPTSQFKPALILYLKRDYDAAIARVEAALPHYPQFWQAHWLLCISVAAAGRPEQAIDACSRAVELSARAPMAIGALGYVLAMAGRHEEARSLAARLEARSASTYVGPASIAIIHGALDQHDRAFEFLKKAYNERDQQLVHAGHAAFFDSLRSDRRFRELRQEAMQTATARDRGPR